jgi:hypothetical protein
MHSTTPLCPCVVQAPTPHPELQGTARPRSSSTSPPQPWPSTDPRHRAAPAHDEPNRLEAAGPFRRGSRPRQLRCGDDGGTSAIRRPGRADRPSEVAAPSKWEATSGRVNWYRAMQWPPGVQSEQHGPWGISKVGCRCQPRAASAARAAPRSATRYTRIGRSPSRCSANSTSGGLWVSWTAATLVPIASTAKTTRPPKTSAKYARSVATSRLGVYTKSSCSKGAGWSVTGRAGGDRASHRARAPGQGAMARLDQLASLRSGRQALTAIVCAWTAGAERMWYMMALMQLVGREETAERVVALHRTWLLLAEDGQPAGGRAIAARTSRWGRWPCRPGHGPKGPAPGQRRRSENSRLRDRRPPMTSIGWRSSPMSARQG